jgi:enoyl-CoA hydratase
MYETLLTALAENIFTITLNRPEKLNALNQTVIRELDRAVQEVYDNPEIRAAIITGSGQKAFAAGADIRGFSGLDAAQGLALAKEGSAVFFKIENAPKPIVAAVNGFALGGGCELAMACHFRLCSENAQFGQPEINLGLIPGYGGTQRLAKYIGRGPALEALLTGNMISARTSWERGLVNHITGSDELMTKTTALLKQITGKSSLAIAKCIRAVGAAFSGEDGYALENQLFGECFGTDDMREGTAAFLEKRQPVFRGS